MSANKHTPEWIVSKLTPCRVDTPDGSISVSWSSNCDGGERNRKAEAAARLIAAAPELLEVARHCENLFMSYALDRIDGDEIADAALALIRAAIEKATGGAA